MKRLRHLIPLIVAFPLLAQQPRSGNPPEEGIPVTDPLVISKCGTCHTKDEKGNLSRISWERAAPEGWEEAIKRMVRLNGLSITPAEARSIVKYLATYHGLAPDEAKPVMYLAEHRIQDETLIPNDEVRTACATCHPIARALSWRRASDDWRLLANLHTGLYPEAETAFRRRPGPADAAGGSPRPDGGAPPPQPVDAALRFLGSAAPLHAPQWAQWAARMRTPKFAGRWLVSARIPGRGKYFGEVTIEDAGQDEFRTRVRLRSARDGSVIERTGQGIVYAGYSWRGRSKSSAPAPAASSSAPDSFAADYREVMWFNPDQSHAEGRWFWGEYQEFGFDVTMERASSELTVTGVDISALKTGTQSNTVHIIGNNLPAQLAPADIDLGSGVTARRIVSSNPGELVVDAAVAPDAIPGKRDVSVRRAVLPLAFAVYDHVDYIKVVPDAALARLGSDVHPKGYQQFEAIGYNRGPDSKINTPDDVDLGPVDVNWSVEEFYATYGDDDKEFVGSLGSNGLFTPSSDGPNPARKFSRNNYGDVWVVATAKNEKDSNGKPLVGKSYLVVTVPTYIKWDQPEVGQ
ncbi:MAG TPA: quinohemoprotein amine dehydrogenase subunit alpha [Bryobacteraceae bacterium]|nr:quinohemoprotein amine dehydrogenase subunit alpha [Bryobacteraceae bacterium]